MRGRLRLGSDRAEARPPHLHRVHWPPFSPGAL